MSNVDILSMAIRNLLKRKLRTFLTILGVVVGTSAIVVMISLGISMNNTFEEELSKMGDITLITVYKPYDSGEQSVAVNGAVQVRPGGGGVKLDNNAIVKFQAIPGVIAATPMVQAWLYAKSGRYVCNFNVIGILPEAMQAMGYILEDGRLLDATDSLTAVYGSEIPYQFFKQTNSWNYWGAQDQSAADRKANVNVMEDRINFAYDGNYIYPQTGGVPPEVKTYRVEAAGLLRKKDDWQTDNSVFMPLRQVQKILEDQQKYQQQQMQDWGYGARAPGQKTDAGYDNAYVKCKDLDTVKQVRDKIIEMGYQAYIPSQQLDSMQKVSESLQGLFGAIGAVALFVAAIGIANTMIMSIYERTREIGVMKVIGALLSDIRKLFLLEAAMIGFFGGILGVGLSLVLSFLLNSSNLSFMNQDYMMTQQSSVSTVTPWLCGLGLIFSTSVGLVSGYFPARRAMRISALAAIRTE